MFCRLGGGSSGVTSEATDVELLLRLILRITALKSGM